MSYARADSTIALDLVDRLRAAAIDVWIDRVDIPAGSTWDREIQRAVVECSILLVLVTPESERSENVLDEVGLAFDLNKPIIPILCRPCDIPYRLRRLQHIDITADRDAGMERLIAFLRAGARTPVFQNLCKLSANMVAHALACSAEGDILVACGSDGSRFGRAKGRISLWRVPSFEPMVRIKTTGDALTDVAIARKGKLLAATTSHTIGLWKLPSGDLASIHEPGLEERLPMARQGLGPVSFSPDDTRLLAGCRLFDIRSERLVAIDQAENVVVNSLATAAPAELDVFKAERPNSAGAYPDSQWQRFIVAGRDDLTIHEFAGGKLHGRIPIGANWRLWELSMAPAGDRIACSYHDRSTNVVTVWGLDDSRKIASVSAGLGSACVAFSPSGQVLAIAEQSGDLHIRDIAKLEPSSAARLPGAALSGGGASALVYSPDGAYICAACRDGSIRLWSTGEA